MSGQEPWGPDLRKPVLNYQTPEAERSAGRVVLEAVAGVFGYVVMAVGLEYLMLLGNVRFGGWLTGLILVTVPPLAVIVGASYGFKAPAMRLAGYITFGVVLLSCGTCYAIIANIGH